MMRSPAIFTIMAAAALNVAAAAAGERDDLYLSRLVKPDSSEGAAPSTPILEGPSLRVEGNRAAVQVDARRTTIMEVLAGLAAAYGVTYRSSIALDKTVDGVYAGSLGHVLTRVLEGYNFVIRQQGARLDVSIFERSGGKAVASPMAAAIRRHLVPTTTRISRNR
jgi:hypothetical protein